MQPNAVPANWIYDNAVSNKRSCFLAVPSLGECICLASSTVPKFMPLLSLFKTPPMTFDLTRHFGWCPWVLPLSELQPPLTERLWEEIEQAEMRKRKRGSLVS